jgi:hypothetical protein
MIGPIAGAKAGAQYPFDIGKINAQADADVRKAAPIAQAQQGARVGPEIAINNAAERAKGEREKSVAANAPLQLDPTKTVVYPPGSPGAQQWQNAQMRGQLPAGVTVGKDGSVTIGAGNATTGTIDETTKDFLKLKDESAAASDGLYKAGMMRDVLKSIGTSGPLTEQLGQLSAYAQQIGVPQDVLKRLSLPSGASVETA